MSTLDLSNVTLIDAIKEMVDEFFLMPEGVDPAIALATYLVMHVAQDTDPGTGEITLRGSRLDEVVREVKDSAEGFVDGP